MRVEVGQDRTDDTVLRLNGDLDLATAAQLRDAAEQALAKAECRLLVLDLSGVGFIDSTGIGALIATRNAALAREVQLLVHAPSPPVRRLLEIAGLDTVFELS